MKPKPKRKRGPKTPRLKPCPFCGGRKLEWSWFTGSVFCIDCESSGASDVNRREAVRLWNRRAKPKGATQ